MSTDVKIKSHRTAEVFISDLERRGIVHSITNRDNLISALAEGKKIYLGIDPTASSLHLGNYFGLTLLNRFLKEGYEVVLLIGGVTALIGDPSFRNKERPVLTQEDINSNVNSIVEEIINFFRNKGIDAEILESNDFDWQSEWTDLISKANKFRPLFEQKFGSSSLTNALEILSWCSTSGVSFPKSNQHKTDSPLLIVNNYRYYKDLSAVDLIRDVCKHINVNEFLHKDFLRDRLATGLTGSEFLYPVCQAWDFYKLCSEENVYIQIGGSDQWGNIVAGLNFLKKKFLLEDNESKEDQVSGLTFPLLTDSSGKKFGKSEENALFLNPEKTDPMHVYQYLRRLGDDLSEKYLLMLTDVTPEEVESWKLEERKNSVLQKKLALYVCEDIYGPEIAKNLQSQCECLYLGSGDLNLEDKEAFKNLSRTYTSQISIIQVLIDLNLAKSNSEARRLIEQGGIEVEGATLNKNDTGYIVKKLASQNYVRIKKGKKEIRIIYFE